MLSRRALFAPAPPAVPAGHWLHVHRTAMACRFEITLPSELGWAIDAAGAALDEVDRIERMLSPFRADSELARLNEHASEAARAHLPCPVSAELYAFLGLGAELARDTDGAFDLASGALARVHGVLARQGRTPTPPELEEARARSGMTLVRFHPERRAVSFARHGVLLNPGAIGKGYALDAAAEILRRQGVRHALLSAGSSSVLAVGPGIDCAGWLVSLGLASEGNVRLFREALGTSGNEHQRHLLDPRTGLPVEGMRHAHVLASSAAIADALSTACFVGGETIARKLVACRSDLRVILATQGDARPTAFGGIRRLTRKEALT